MRSRSSKHAKEMERVKLREEQPHLSGAYIRSLVKQLSSSRTKQPMNPPKVIPDDGDGKNIVIPSLDDGFNETQPQTRTPPPPPPPQHKKQVRRRLHTTRPYQERLLNMAEARREIVTALKFHRAAMKQANEQQQEKPPEPPLPPQQNPHPLPSLEPHEKPKSRKNPRIYPSNTPSPNISTFSNYINNIHTPFSYPPPSNPYQWACPPIPPPPIIDHLNLALPTQPLGLNLNLHDFNNIDTALFQYNDDDHPSINTCYSSSSPSSSSSHTGAPSDGAFHSAIDDREMAKIRSIGDQHDMEWNDTLNLVTSAWWFKFLKNMESSPESNEERGDEDGFHSFDEVMDIPAWLTVGNSGENCFLQEHLHDYHSPGMLQDDALPCMDIGEIEGMDTEWLS